MALNGTAIIGNRILEEFRVGSDEYVQPSTLVNNIQVASEQLQNMFLGLIMMYGPGKPIPPQASTLTSDIRNLLDPFRYKIPYYNTTINNAGAYIFDGDVSVLTGLDLQITKTETITFDGRTIFFPQPEALSDFLDSKVNYPTEKNPIGSYEGLYQIAIYPAPGIRSIIEANVIVGEQQLTLNYLPNSKKIVDPDPLVTTPTKWSQRAWECIVYLALQHMGIQSTQPFLLQSVEQLKRTSV
jgi:hypothetical protein